MSEMDVPYGEGSFLSEDTTLVLPADKQKHAARTEKDDATLLSDGSSEEDNEDELVLEYTDGCGVSGSLQDSVDYEEGGSTTASDNEISAPSNDNIEYKDSAPSVTELVSFVSENGIDSSQNAQTTDVKAKKEILKDVGLHNNEISKIAEALSSTKIDSNKVESIDSNENVAPPPGKAVPGNNKKMQSDGFEETEEEASQTSYNSLSDSENIKNSNHSESISTEQSLNDDLEWEEEYQLDEVLYHERSLKNKAKMHLPRLTNENSEELLDVQGSKETSFMGDTTTKTEDKNQVYVENKKPGLKDKAANDLDKSSSQSCKESRIVQARCKRGPEAVQTFTASQKQIRNNNEKPAGNKIKKNKHKLRHKIYLDDPDIHQRISDYTGLLKKFISEVEIGKFVPKAQNRLHPVSRDDVFEVKTKKKERKKRYTAPSTLKMMDQQLDDNPEPSRSQSAGHLGPYDGHGRRGRNLITRIKGLSESSSSSPDDDEITNNKISGVGKQGSLKSRTAVCTECGEQHSLDEDSDEDSDQEICPDCGVPHNPFQHPPSPSAKNKWRQYVEHCRKAMLQISSSTYQQVSQDPPEHAKDEDLPSIEGPHTTEELSIGARYKMKYLGTTQVVTQHPVTKETRMQQAQEAYCRIKVPEGEVQPCTETEMIISLERLKVVNCEGKHDDVMMDHALRTVCFICDIGNIMVLMSRRLTTDLPDLKMDDGSSVSLANMITEREKRTSKNICHIFECDEAQLVSKAIGQAFNMAYRQFLRSNGISHDNVEEAEYCHVLESQKIVGQDLDLLTDRNNSRDVVIQKKRSEALGLMLLESGWGSMLPTVFIAHIANYSPAARLGGQISVGDHVLACNGASLVGLPLSECNQLLRNTRSSARVVLKLVACPPVVDVVVSRPDTKYQLGFSVQNGTICSLLRGGIAERGGVRVGHRIIEINGQSVVAKTHQHIVDILAHTSGEISMKTLPVSMYRLMVGIDTPVHV